MNKREFIKAAFAIPALTLIPTFPKSLMTAGTIFPRVGESFMMSSRLMMNPINGMVLSGKRAIIAALGTELVGCNNGIDFFIEGHPKTTYRTSWKTLNGMLENDSPLSGEVICHNGINLKSKEEV